ncbi:muscle M-line assembly protein unc-89 [Halyomorpha halys]|uniref:muscle M-line assembly protein unc-89 n=1 Tax=Halyomorpha halys TaxID=286706 RepID=UPI0006D4DA23|nr:uncharacterized protein LOC106690320 [Halyomorpha halys]
MGSGGSKHKQSRNFQASERSSPPGKPYLVPGSPRSDPDVITIKWDPPIYGGGSKIIGYVVEHKRTASPHWVKATPVLVKHHQLSLSGLEPGMRYQFRVSAENSGGRSDPSPLSEPIAISHQRGVAIAPIFVKNINDSTALENEKVEFTVRVEGTPFPKISWYKDGFEVFSNRRQKVSTDGNVSTFVIHQAALTDEGEIKCCATNKAGHAVSKASLTLQALPAIRLPRQYEDGILFELGEAVKLKVSINGRPPPEVTWYHNGQALVPGPRVECATTDRYAMLRISNATREDRGEYQVRAINCLGEDTASLLVTITDRPLPPGKVNVVMTLGRCVTLAWTIPYDDGGCKIGNYIVEYFRIGWNMWLKAATCRQLTTTIGDLIEGSEYKFRVKAENPYGISDPSEESDTIFIPDPKRGLLEPPPQGAQMTLDDVPDQWLESRADRISSKNSHKHNVMGDWNEDSPIPSPVLLANQVLRKVKMAPKRGWSEDSQGSPPRETPPSLPPIPPKRKHRASPSSDKASSPIEEKEKSKSTSSGWRWEKELSPRSNDDEMHSSSEMMLVLLPNKRKQSNGDQGEDKSVLSPDDFESEAGVAPPLSLSAPELSSCEPFDFQELRLSASSSEIMHELALIRFNKEASEEEAELHLKQRYGIERKRSFERRSSKTKENFISSRDNLPSIENILTKAKELKMELNSPSKVKRLSDSSDELEERESRADQFSERFQNLEKCFKEYTALTNMKVHSDDESDKISSNYSDDEIDEDTYHPRNMTPSNTNMSQESVSHSLAVPYKPPMITINEEPEPLKIDSPELKRKSFMDGKNSPDFSTPFRRSLTPERSMDRSRSPSPNIVVVASADSFERHQPPVLPVIPKPILKTREKSVEKSDRPDASVYSLKKVRIEEPEEKEKEEEKEGIFLQHENDIGLEAGEVARNRRKKVQSTEESEGTKVIVNLYSDIVREFGQSKKHTSKLYLSYDELKAAAEKNEENKFQPTEDNFKALNQNQQKTQSEEKEIIEIQEVINNVKVVKKPLEVKSKQYMEYLLDFFLFLIACWLYFFKDARLTIPILILMLYRQVNETVKNVKLPWQKKKNHEQ